MAQPPSRPEARSRLGSQTANELGAPVASSIPEQLLGARPHQQGRDTKMAMLSFRGIDVSKDRLDVVVLPEQQCSSVRNDAAGGTELIAQCAASRSQRSVKAIKKKSFPVGWLRVRGKAEQSTECDHATSFCSGANGGQCRDLFLALHAGDPTSGFAHGAGPGCARGASIKKSARPPRHSRTSAGASSITAKVVRARPSNRPRVAFFYDEWKADHE